MVFSRVRKFLGIETMRDRLKPYLQKLEYRYRSNEGTARKLLSDGWKKKRHRIVYDHFKGDKVRMNNPTERDFRKIAELLFKEWHSKGEADEADGPAGGPAYGPAGDPDLY